MLEHMAQQGDLPESLQEVAGVIGVDGAFDLVQEYGGTRIFVPRKMREHHKLVASLGMERARRLAHHFGGETLSVVRNAELLRRTRNRQIVESYNTGVGVRQLARDHALTERQIYSILGKVQ
ncbi:MAG: hypothetical protein HQL99_13300 [Magnetococcales bacterium]|nr:hypothetical protein [Magnetococcales bacterium]